MFPLAGCGFWGSGLCCLAMVTIRLEPDLGPKTASAKVVLTCQSCNLPYPQRSPPFSGGGGASGQQRKTELRMLREEGLWCHLSCWILLISKLEISGNYTGKYSFCFAQASCISAQHPDGHTDLFSFSCYPVFCGR